MTSPEAAFVPTWSATPAQRLATAHDVASARAAAPSRQLAGLAEEQAHTTHDDEHDPEGVTVGYERALLQSLLASTRQEIVALNRASARIAAGTYGVCTGCGRPLAAERLDAVPAAETCIACVATPRRR